MPFCDCIITVDHDGRIREFNPAAELAFGYRRDEVLGRELAETIIPPSLREAHRKGFRRYLETGETSVLGGRTEVTAMHADGREFPVEVGLTRVQRPGSPLFTAYVRDITERKFAQERLVELFENAHDFNKRLQAISGYTELAQKHHDGDVGRARRDLDEIGRAAAAAAALTQQLLAYSRKQMLRPQTIGVNTLFEQALINLCLNSRDAMRTGDQLTISTRHADTNGIHAVALVVTDTGCGMDSETQDKAIQPFFTTKELGSGTGLGLSSVYGTVTQSGGHFEIESNAGDGSRVTLAFPCPEAGPTEAAAAANPRPCPGAGELVLLAEDDPSVRAILSEALEHWNYRVLSAEDGASALRLAPQHIDELALLVTDGVMPEMNGAELIAAVKRLRPDLPALYVSGYSHRLDPEGADDVLQKPVSLEEFAATVSGMLRSRPRRFAGSRTAA